MFLHLSEHPSIPCLSPHLTSRRAARSFSPPLLGSLITPTAVARMSRRVIGPLALTVRTWQVSVLPSPSNSLPDLRRLTSTLVLPRPPMILGGVVSLGQSPGFTTECESLSDQTSHVLTVDIQGTLAASRSGSQWSLPCSNQGPWLGTVACILCRW